MQLGSSSKRAARLLQLGEGVVRVHGGTITAGGGRRSRRGAEARGRAGVRRRPVADEGEAAVRVERRRQPEALDLVAALVAQEVQLRLGLDALGDDVQAQRMAPS